MGWITQPYYNKGFAEGYAEAIAENKASGRAEGAAELLIIVLKERFGTLPEAVQEHIFAADIASLEGWVDRVFDAPDLQSVFNSN